MLCDSVRVPTLSGVRVQVGPKKQVREIRETKVASQGRNTPFGMAFRGVLAHHNRNPGKPESINLEPFTLLNVRPEIGAAGRDSVAAGLRRLCSRYRNPETGQEHRSLIAELPPVRTPCSPHPRCSRGSGSGC